MWRRIESIGGLSATLPTWRAVLGEYFHEFASFLRPTSRSALAVPCPNQCYDGCYRRVIAHGHDDLVGTCPGGRCAIPLSPQDVIIHEINVRKLSDALASSLHLEAGFEEILDVPITWRLGVHAATPVRRIPVFLSLCGEPIELHDLAGALLLRSVDPIFLLGMTRADCLPRTEAMLRNRASIYAPLEELVRIQRGMPMALQELQSFIAPCASYPRRLPADVITLGRLDFEDGPHWIVNGVDKGVFARRGNPIKQQILEILFEQIGNGWVSHETFMHACGWSGERYFGSPSEGRIIQKHLTDIRSFLGIGVVFLKDRGVRFPEKVIRTG